MLLDVQGLQLATHDGAKLVESASFSLQAGQTLALVGESASGKSLSALAITGLLPNGVARTAGLIRFDGMNLSQFPADGLRAMRGTRIAMIFQEPMTSLNPLMTVAEQVAQPLRFHRRLARHAARSRAIALLEQVGIPDATARADAYPHQLSGGMRQRVMIALALACEPQLLIADEPTTALDVTVQAQILAVLRERQQASGLGILFITHDLAVVAEFAHQTAVMYAGRVVESGPTAALIASPSHPYSRALLRSLPPAAHAAIVPPQRVRLHVIPGEVPTPRDRPPGCAFHPRCDEAGDDPRCRTRIPVLESSGPGRVACWRATAAML